MFEVIKIDKDGKYLGIAAMCELKSEADMICSSLNSTLATYTSERFEVRNAVTNGFSIPQMLAHISDDICVNYCKYHDGLRIMRCNYTDEGGICPLDQLNW